MKSIKRVLLILSHKFEEIEAVTALDLLRRAGIEMISASTGPDLLVEGGRGIKIQADRLLKDCQLESFDMIILPGGPGVAEMRKNSVVLDLVRHAYAMQIPIAAICAAPLVLSDAGITSSHTITSFPDAKGELESKIKAYSEDRVVADGIIITSRGAGTSEEFALGLIAYLLGPTEAEAIRSRIIAR